MLLNRLRSVLLALAVLLLTGEVHAQSGGPAPERQFGLLVGCSTYLDSQIPALDGPRNDVPLYLDLLTKTYGFRKENITTLVGWPAEEERRPTYRNIVAGFDRLISKAGPGVQIFILLAGHGVQVPIPATQVDALDPRNPEPDGMDEVFLPADVQRWKAGVGLKNHILDDQIGAWLDALEAKGAAVWIVFDCCHSGTMSRDPSERSRQVLPHTLGIPREALEDAARKARIAQAKLRQLPGERARSVQPPSDLLQLNTRKKGPGSVVAFYAAQPFETTPELPRPQGAAQSAENYYGLLSYTLIGLLKQHHHALTYRELAQLLTTSYRGERGANGPTPFAEGDLDRQVLGAETFPARSAIILQRRQGRLEVNAGELMGVTTGSILAARPPATDKSDPKKIIGYLKVTSAAPGFATLEPCPGPDGTTPAVAASTLPELSRCEVVYQDIGNMRLNLAVVPPENPNPAMARLQVVLQEALQQLPREIRQLVVLTDNPARAEWSLTPDSSSITLRRNENRPLSQAALEAGKAVPEEYVRYTPNNAGELSILLARDLQRIYTWQNLWRIAGRTGGQPGGQGQLEIRVVKRKENGEPGELLTPGSMVRAIQPIQLEVTNRSFKDLYVTVLILDSRCGIQALTTSLSAQKSLAPLRGTIEEKPGPGPEGFVLLATPIAPGQDRPNFEFLQQPSLGQGNRDVDRPQKLREVPPTPFNQLLKTAAIGQGARGFRLQEPTNPAVLSWGWVTLPGR